MGFTANRHPNQSFNVRAWPFYPSAVGFRYRSTHPTSLTENLAKYIGPLSCNPNQ
jgi:hypothetical protein